MKDVIPTGRNRLGDKEFKEVDLSAYVKNGFRMFGGERTVVTLKCNNRLLDTIVDKFGTDGVMCSIYDEDNFTVTIPIEVSDMFFGWVLGFETKMQIMKPEKVVKGFTDYIDRIRSIYPEVKEDV